jgi:hypothetical protein
MALKQKIRLMILADRGAQFFLKWELPYFRKEFELVSNPGADVVLLNFAPGRLGADLDLPALRRCAFLIPGFDFNPYHNMDQRKASLDLIERHYDLIFVNPGPIEEALNPSAKLVSLPFSIDIDRLCSVRRLRRSIESLIHVSADAPQKDWERSEQVMGLTGLRYEVYPPRRSKSERITWSDRLRWRYNKYLVKALAPTTAFRRNLGYLSHAATIRRYCEYDGFVHVAKEKPDPIRIDGKYTAALLEAGATGAIVFWHDTFGIGTDFETIFSVPVEPESAAKKILEIRERIDVADHSRRTMEEIADRCHPSRVVSARRRAIERIL